MTKLIWALLCRKSVIEQDTNNISIEDAYESLQFDIGTGDVTPPKGQPIGFPFEFEVVSLFFRDKAGEEDSIEKTVIILDPSSKKLGEFKFEGHFKAEQNRIRVRMKFTTIALTTSGTYIFQVFSGKVGESSKKLVAAIPVDIKFTLNGKPQ